MANELKYIGATGQTGIFAVVLDAQCRAVNPAIAGVEPVNPAHWPNYARPANEQGAGTGIYAATMPTAAQGAGGGAYDVLWYKRLGSAGSEAPSDTYLDSSSLAWDGAKEVYAGGPVASVTAPVTVGTNNDKSGYLLAPGGLDAIMVEAGVNARQALSPILAVAAGVLLGAGTGTIVIKGGNTAITRVTAVTDTAGNRVSVTLVLP